LEASGDEDAAGRARRRLIVQFASELRELWTRAGRPSYRRIAQDLRSAGSHYSKSTIGDVLNGVRRPAADLLFALVSYLQGNTDEWAARLAELDRRLDGLEGRAQADPPPKPTTFRRVWRWALTGALAIGVSATIILRLVGFPGSARGLQTPVGCYEVYRPEAQLLDGKWHVVGWASVGNRFAAEATTDRPYAHRRYGHVRETGQRGWIDEAKIRRSTGDCS
jgi:hypothetical protein